MSRTINGLFPFTSQTTENIVEDLGIVMLSEALKTNTTLVTLALEGQSKSFNGNVKVEWHNK